jgi:MOSC domain-containing protein YiiM
MTRADMKLISINVGLPRVVMNNGEPVTSGIFKDPVAGRVMLRTLNLDGDRQADLSVHGGPTKAVYVYPSEHYDYWKGSAVVMVTEPRMPCYKLGIKFGRADIIKRFLASERTGFYFAVLQEGEVGAGDPIKLIEKSKDSVRVSDITLLYTRKKRNVGLLRRAIEVEALPESWKKLFSAST